MAYVDGFVLPVPEANKQAFIDHARWFADIFLEYGATRVTECWQSDVPEGETTSFPLAVKREAGEAVVFSWVEWPDRRTREASMAKMMEDPRLGANGPSMPFDGKRLIMGGFETVVTAMASD
ncbi:MAG: DUF1428 domain-containing protein [Maricaulaceae bacterium]